MITHLKKENEYLIENNLINWRLLGNLFYFINLLSQKFDPIKKVFNLSHYFKYSNELSSDLNNLYQCISSYNNRNDINYKNEYKSNSSKQINEIEKKFKEGEEFSLGKIVRLI